MSETHWTRESLLQFLGAHKIAYQEERHSAVFTMAESARLGLSLPGARCKNLLVRNRKGTDCFLVVTQVDAVVDTGALGRALGIGRLSFCSPAEMKELLGVEPGAMSPFALVADRDCRKVRLLMDEVLKAEPHFLFHPLVNTATVSICSEDFLHFLSATGHSLEFVTVPYRTVEASSLQ